LFTIKSGREVEEEKASSTSQTPHIQRAYATSGGSARQKNRKNKSNKPLVF
jgi:hypothetical protein